MSDPRSPAKDRKYRLLKPGKQQISRKKIHSLDIETYDRNRRLLMTSVSYDSEIDICFLRQHGCIEHLKHDWNSADSIYSATNLGFDFFGLFYNTDDLEEFLTLFRGSGLIYAKTSLTDEGFKYGSYDMNRNQNSMKFLDTMNYSPIGVKRIGDEILKIQKLDVKEIVGRMPVDHTETSAMMTYNIRDCEISKKFMVFIKDSIEELGGTFKDTIASSALSIFRNVYLKKAYFVHPIPVLKDVFKSYYGGRCEVFKRGTVEKMYYYDINCFSEDTEILTDKGFKRYDELDVAHDMIFSMKEESLVMDRIDDIIIKPYHGIMVRLVNENTDQLVTPNHRIYHKTYNRTQWHKDNDVYGWTDRWKVREAKDIPKTYVMLPNAKSYDGHLDIDDDLLRLSAWFITEGHLSHNKFEISQSWTKNPDRCEMILEILRRLGISYRRADRFQKGKKYLYVYIDYDVILPVMHRRFNDSYEMRLPDDFMMYSLRSKKILFDEMMKGDGCFQDGKATYVSFSDRLLDDFQILCTMIGLKCSVHKKYHAAYIKMHRTGNSTNPKKSFEEYHGNVWCVSVKEKNVVVRRNGKVFISGNSLYPSCMMNRFPDPNTLRTSYVNSVEKIMQYEGCSDVDIFCPNMRHPLLPYRMPSKKVVFPCGSFDGWYTHVELRKAIELGYRIIKVRKSHWYKDTCEPFKEFVEDMYNKRMMWQSEKNPMEVTAKLVMNSLYGKMGQTFVKRQNYIPYDLAVADDRLIILDRIGDYARVEQIEDDPANYCFPIWASYVTSYGRLKLYEYITRLDPAYCDTDSIMTRYQIDTSKELGEMKLEMVINEGVLVKPKFYALHGFKMKDGMLKEVEEVKIKGFSRAVSFLEIAGERIDLEDKKRMKKFLTYLEFKGFLSTPRARYNKFLKLKEALRRDMLPNEDVIVRKEFTLEDDKRMWKGKFKVEGLEESRSMIINALEKG